MNSDILLPYQERVVIEKEELDIKISNLEKFINNSTFNDLTLCDQNILKYQLTVMNEYSSVLNLRILNFKRGTL